MEWQPHRTPSPTSDMASPTVIVLRKYQWNVQSTSLKSITTEEKEIVEKTYNSSIEIFFFERKCTQMLL
ncbi:hypothetical protein T06_6278 [Trichinella sp. T6]|nr:hypothetical protein T06_6278 [Trichinella sp. T6]